MFIISIWCHTFMEPPQEGKRLCSHLLLFDSSVINKTTTIIFKHLWVNSINSNLEETQYFQCAVWISESILWQWVIGVNHVTDVPVCLLYMQFSLITKGAAFLIMGRGEISSHTGSSFLTWAQPAVYLIQVGLNWLKTSNNQKGSQR